MKDAVRKPPQPRNSRRNPRRAPAAAIDGTLSAGRRARRPSRRRRRRRRSGGGARAEKAEAKAAADAAKAAAKAAAPATEEAKAPKGPKKPRTAFIFFGDKARPEVAAANLEAKAADVTKLLAERWKGMGADERAEYAAAAEQDKERYARECAAGVAPPLAAADGAPALRDRDAIRRGGGGGAGRRKVAGQIAEGDGAPPPGWWRGRRRRAERPQAADSPAGEKLDRRQGVAQAPRGLPEAGPTATRAPKRGGAVADGGGRSAGRRRGSIGDAGADGGRGARGGGGGAVAGAGRPVGRGARGGVRCAAGSARGTSSRPRRRRYTTS